MLLGRNVGVECCVVSVLGELECSFEFWIYFLIGDNLRGVPCSWTDILPLFATERAALIMTAVAFSRPANPCLLPSYLP